MFVSVRTQGPVGHTIVESHGRRKQVNRSGGKQESSECVLDIARPATTADESRTDRVRSWRRRVLQRRGAQMHAAMARDGENLSLAMLDETGVVVSWYGQVGAPDELVLDRHVSQFYLPGQIASNQPLRDLRSTVVRGRTTLQGWRRRADGTTFWGSVVIEAIVLRDGRLQGFSYAMGVSSERIPRRISCLAPLLLGLSLCAALPVAAAPGELPEHARVSRYGSGWDCRSGFRRVGDSCAHIVVPANGYLDASGRDWRCDRGYLNVNNRCVVIQVPQNAYLDDVSGKGWRCEPRYRDVDGACRRIEVPVNAHATASSYGSGWECDRGFRLAGIACLPIAVPAQGFLSRSGDAFECERGYRKDDAACIAVQLPANAHLDYSGSDWQCDEGFHIRGAACVQD
jgi:hypothetical protein